MVNASGLIICSKVGELEFEMKYGIVIHMASSAHFSNSSVSAIEPITQTIKPNEINSLSQSLVLLCVLVPQKV